MNTVRLWLAASACSLVVVSSAKLRAEGAAATERKSASITPNGHKSRLERGAMRSPSRTLPAILQVASPSRGSSTPFTRFALAPQRTRSPCVERCREPRVPDRALARTSGILASVAAASVAAGVVVVLSRPARRGRDGRVPELKLRLSGARAIASAGWRF
jgi:hypothetical protein